MVSKTDQVRIAYQATLHGAAFFKLREAGTLRVEGQDQITFLQRQTTNDINLLSPSRSLVTVLVNPAARILDVLRLSLEGSGLSVLTLPGNGASTAQFLKSRIFFMDKVSVQDLSQEYVQYELDGPQAGELLLKLAFDHPPELDENLVVAFSGGHLKAIGKRGLNGLGYLLVARVDQASSLQSAIRQHGAEELDEETYTILRVEAGIPGVGAELNSRYTPLEAGLHRTVAADKGCYTGQEIIARQITYDKVTQHLVGLQLEAIVPSGETLWAEGRAVGTVTSAVVSPASGPLALGIIKRPFHNPGTILTAAAKPEVSGVTATVAGLPFRPQATP